ncbi:MAG: class I SAM-dependent methyltransferase [Gemmatimonadales bacterium]
MRTIRPWPLAIASLLLTGSLAAQQGEESRERWQRVPDVVAALGVAPGTRVADVGAGAGFFTARLARAVGTEGRVFALDVDGAVIAQLRRRAAREQWANVEIVHSSPTDPRLPDAGVDAALIMNAYHEFTDPEAMLRGVARALEPGGRLVIIDQVPPGRRLGEERDTQERAHELGSWFAVRDLLLAGFRIVRLEDPFIKRDEGGAQADWWLLVAQAPARPGHAP